MKIDIERFNLKDVHVDPEAVFTFPEGFVGFESSKRFSIFHEEGKPTVFWLQSLDDPELMFSIVAPELIDLEYRIELSDQDCALLDLHHAEDAVVVVMVYRDAVASERIAASTRSPLILNLKNRRGMQKVLQEVHPTLLYRAK